MLSWAPPLLLIVLGACAAGCAIVVEERDSFTRAAPATSAKPVASVGAEPEFIPYPPFQNQSEVCANSLPAFDPLDTWIGSYEVTPAGLGPVNVCSSQALRVRAVRVGAPTADLVVQETEVTYRCYKYCVDRGDCAPPTIDPADPLPYRWDDFRRATLAVTFVTRADAEAYCKAFGSGWRLPTWAELTSMTRGARESYAHPKLVTDVLGCVLGAPSPTPADRCKLFLQHVPGPDYRASQFPAIFPWDPLDQDKAGHSITYGNLAGINLVGGVAERTLSHLDPTAHCSTADGAVDTADADATSHLVFAPLVDLLRARDAGRPTMPEQVDDDFRSFTLGFRCAR